MHDIRYALRAFTLILPLAALGGCGGGGLGLPGSDTPGMAAPMAPPANMAGRWMLSSPGRGQCAMNFGGAPNSPEGTIAPEGGCPGKFYMSRKWTYDQSGLTMRDHRSQPLAQLSGDGGRFEGKSAAGEPVTLTR